MSTPNDSYGFFQSGAPSLKFLTIGTLHSGVICEEPYVQQQTDPNGGIPKVWKNGDPMLQLVVPMKTDYRDPEIEDDDGERRLFIANKGMREAVQKAVSAAGAKGLDVGGTLTVQWVAEGEKTNPAFNAPKIYAASYIPPVGGQSGQFLGTASAASNPAPQTVPATAGATAVPVGGNGSAPAGVAPTVNAGSVSAGVQPVVNAGPVPANTMPPQPAVQLPNGMTPEVWNSLSPEARQALASLPTA